MWSEWTWCTEHKRKKNRQHKSCVQEGNEADRATKCMQNSDESGKPLLNIISL
jgi:hypothetical protein